MHKIIFIILIITLNSIAMNKPAFFFITGNPGKFKELKSIVPEIEQLDIDLEEIQSTGGKAVIEAKVKEAFRDIDKKIQERSSKPFKNAEAQKNFTRVAPLARNAFRNGTARVIIEDTSLYFDALANTKAEKSHSDDMPNGLPGPLIKWFDETVGNQGLYTIAQAFGNFNARAVTWIGYSQNGSDIQYFKGEIPGTIVNPTGSQGFGWDPVFKPTASKKTFAQMAQEEKNNFSMRGMAARALRDAIGKDAGSQKTGSVQEKIALYENLGHQKG